MPKPKKKKLARKNQPAKSARPKSLQEAPCDPKTICPPLYYKFGQKSMGLLGVALMSNGSLKVFARRRKTPGGDSEYLYTSTPYIPKGAFEVSFTLRLNSSPAAPKAGIFTAEALCWPGGYEVDRLHTLGMFDPFGTNDEIVYNDGYLGGTNRSTSAEPNRTFLCQLRFDPAAKAPLDRAVLTMSDVDSMVDTTDAAGKPARRPSCNDIIYLPALDSFDANGRITDYGGVIIAVRVNEATYANGCAQLEFMNGFQVEITENTRGRPAKHQLGKIVLNLTTSPL